MAFLWGVLPDLFAFTIPFTAGILGFREIPRPDIEGSGPSVIHGTYIYQLYQISHSLLIFAIVFGLVWYFRKRPYIPMLAWPLHILVDIPTHTTRFFSTPFLWPFPHPHVNGIPWSDSAIFIPNIILLAVLYGWWWFRRLEKP